MRSSTQLARFLVGVAVCARSVQALDYVIVGGAGGDGLGNINISDVTRIGAAWGTQVDWQFHTEPLLHAGNRSVGNAPRGKERSINYRCWEKAERFFPPKPADDIGFTLAAHGLSGNIATSYSSAAPPEVHTHVSQLRRFIAMQTQHS
ncbi:hypothetical protein GGX14DRAFT_565275 [Mycena pura]|uniref:Uncharacterized protein n=1 Tax=Mycena pura TaxID=153505 RepID=A0AAD6VFF5_9AGAR|nr:hypothetical protein GGX14DRAFT_565275 [Mycena pura]